MQSNKITHRENKGNKVNILSSIYFLVLYLMYKVLELGYVVICNDQLLVLFLLFILISIILVYLFIPEDDKSQISPIQFSPIYVLAKNPFLFVEIINFESTFLFAYQVEQKYTSKQAWRSLFYLLKVRYAHTMAFVYISLANVSILTLISF